MQRSALTYSTGTIRGAQGQPQIIGLNTNWTSTDANGTVSYAVAAFDELLVPGQRSLLIISVDDAATLTLSENLPFGIPAGSSYLIIKRTPSPTGAVLSALARLQAQGSDAAPDPSRTFDNGVSRLRIGFDTTGNIRLEVGPTGGASYHTALLMDPLTGNVTVTGGGGSGGGSANTILTTVNAPSNAVGKNGDVAIDPIAVVFYGPKQNGQWPDGISMIGPAADPTALNNAVAAAQAAKTTAQQAVTDAQAARDQAASVLSGALRFDEAQTLTAGQQNQVDTNLGRTFGECIFYYQDATHCILMPRSGRGRLTINQQTQRVPNTGIQITPAGMTNSQGTYIYAYMNGATMALEGSPIGHVTGPDGTEVKSTDATRALVGWVVTVGGNFIAQSDGTVNRVFVRSWYNTAPLVMAAGTPAGQNIGSTSWTAATYVIEALIWGKEAIDLTYSANHQFLGSAASTGYAGISYDGTGNTFTYSSETLNVTNYTAALSTRRTLFMSENYHNFYGMFLSDNGQVWAVKQSSFLQLISIPFP